jgi:small subunit ribosomal protein S8
LACAGFVFASLPTKVAFPALKNHRGNFMDVIADMFAKIKNAQAVQKETVLVPHSKLKMEIAKMLLKNNYIKEINRRGKKNKKILELVLNYDENNQGLIKHIVRVSKPSRRVYFSLKEIKPRQGRRRGRGLLILSTSQGLLTDKEAVKEKTGGEVICEIW